MSSLVDDAVVGTVDRAEKWPERGLLGGGMHRALCPGRGETMEPKRQYQEMKIAGNFPSPAPYLLLRSLHRRCLQPLPTVRSRLVRGGLRAASDTFLTRHQHPEKDRYSDAIMASRTRKSLGDRRFSNDLWYAQRRDPQCPSLAGGSWKRWTQWELPLAGDS